MRYTTEAIPVMPFIVSEKSFEKAHDNLSLAISNVPFSEESWYLCGQKVTKRALFAQTLTDLSMVIIPITYEDKLRIQICSNKNLDMNTQQFLDILIHNIKEDISLEGNP